MNILETLFAPFFGNCDLPTAATPANTARQNSNSANPTTPATDVIQIQSSLPLSYFELRGRLEHNHDTRLPAYDRWLDQMISANERRAEQGRPNRRLAFSVSDFSFSTYLDVNRSAIPWRVPPPSFYLSEDAGMSVHFSGSDTQFNPQNAQALFHRPYTPFPDSRTSDALFFATYGLDSLIEDGYASIQEGRFTLHNSRFWNLLENHVAQNLNIFRRRDLHFTEQSLSHYLGSFFIRQVPESSRSNSDLNRLGEDLRVNRLTHPVVLDELIDEALAETSPTAEPLLDLPPETTDHSFFGGIIQEYSNWFSNFASYNGERPFSITQFIPHIRQGMNFSLEQLFFDHFFLLSQNNSSAILNRDEQRAQNLTQNSLTLNFDTNNFFQSLSLSGHSHFDWALMQVSPSLVLGPGYLNMQGATNGLQVDFNDFHFQIDPTLNSTQATLKNGFLSTQGLAAASFQTGQNTIEIAPGLHVRRTMQTYPVGDQTPHAVLEVTGNVAFNVEGEFGRSSGQLVFMSHFRWDEQGLRLIPGASRFEIKNFNLRTPGAYPRFLQFRSSNVSLTDIPDIIRSNINGSVETPAAAPASRTRSGSGFLFQIEDRGRTLNTFVPLTTEGAYYNLRNSFSPFSAHLQAHLNPGNFALDVNSNLNPENCSRNLRLHWTTQGIIFDNQTRLESGVADLNLNLRLLEAGLLQYNLNSVLQGTWSGRRFDLLRPIAALSGMQWMLGSILRNNRYSGTLNIEAQGRVRPETADIRGSACVRPTAEGNISILDARRGTIPVFNENTSICANFRRNSIVTNVDVSITPRGFDSITSPNGNFSPAIAPAPSTEPFIIRVQNYHLASWPLRVPSSSRGAQ